MKNIVFDIETDGLDPSKIHCLGLLDLSTGEQFTFNDQGGDKPPISQGVCLLDGADHIVGHNIIGFDIPVVHKFYPFFNPAMDRVADTLLLSHLFHPNLLFIDCAKKRAGMPTKLYGGHGLAAWGHRLGEYKGDFGEAEGCWEKWSPEMESYMSQDVNVTGKLWTHFLPYLIG